MKSIKYLIIISIIVIVMFGFFKNIFSQNNPQLIKEAYQNGAMLVDVRSSSEFGSGSVEGAVNIPLDIISGQISKFKNKKNIIVFCKSGTRSGMAKSILEKNGIKNVVNGGSWENVKKIINE